MTDWLRATMGSGNWLNSPEVVAGRLVMATAFGFVVVLLRMPCRGRGVDESRTLATTLILLSVLVCLLTIVIDDSVARAFGLVGALSIVRFRTVVQDTRDTAFVIFAVVVGMSSGSGYALLAAMTFPLVLAIVLGFRLTSGRSPERQPQHGILTVRLATVVAPETLLMGVSGRLAEPPRLRSIASARKGEAFDCRWEVVWRGPDDMVELVRDLHRIEGVSEIELRQGS